MRGRSGFTLAEAILALGLSVVIILVAVALGITATRSNQKSSDIVAANGWAAQEMENYVYGLPPGSDPFWSTTSYAVPYATDDVQLGTSKFHCDFYLTDMGSVGAGLKKVVVNVTWGSGTVGQTGYGQQVTSLARLIYGQ